jgi:hypothetical protein
MLTMKTKQGLFFVVALLCVVSCCIVRVPLLGQDADSAKSKLTSLLEERRDVLKARVEMVEKLASMAKSTPEELIAARDDLFDAEYELATGSEQRIAALQQKLENARQLEAVMRERKNDAKGTEIEVLMAKAGRIGVEVKLLRETDKP